MNLYNIYEEFTASEKTKNEIDFYVAETDERCLKAI